MSRATLTPTETIPDFCLHDCCHSEKSTRDGCKKTSCGFHSLRKRTRLQCNDKPLLAIKQRCSTCGGSDKPEFCESIDCRLRFYRNGVDSRHITPSDAVRLKCKVDCCLGENPMKACGAEQCPLFGIRNGKGTTGKNVLRLINLKCNDCDPEAAPRACQLIDCPIWIYREGRNPHRKCLGGDISNLKNHSTNSLEPSPKQQDRPDTHLQRGSFENNGVSRGNSGLNGASCDCAGTCVVCTCAGGCLEHLD